MPNFWRLTTTSVYKKIRDDSWKPAKSLYSKASWDTASWDTDLAGTRFWNRSKIFSDTLIFNFFLENTRFFMGLYIFSSEKCTVLSFFYFSYIKIHCFLLGFSPLMLYLHCFSSEKIHCFKCYVTYHAFFFIMFFSNMTF